METKTPLYSPRTKLHSAFPQAYSAELTELLSRLSASSNLLDYSNYVYPVLLKGENIEIPVRIYWSEATKSLRNGLSQPQLLMLHCLLSRHHHGYIREECLRTILSSQEYWVIPYIVQLLGEYVIEIIQVLERNFDHIHTANLIEFIEQNPIYWQQTKSRVVSYWNCYYRAQYPYAKSGWYAKEAYPGVKLIQRIESLRL